MDRPIALPNIPAVTTLNSDITDATTFGTVIAS